MNTLDKIIIGYSLFFFIHFIIYLLYQFDKIKISERGMIQWIRFLNILETILLIITHVFSYTVYGTWGLAVFYILNISLLILQCIFAEWGVGRKILDFFWIGFYVLLFSMDICNIGIAEITAFFSNAEELKIIKFIFKETIIGEILVGVITPVLRTLILETLQKER